MPLFLALLAALAVDSTHVTGTALVLASGRPLSGVRVTLGPGVGVTDTSGAFALSVPAGATPLLGFTWGGRTGTARLDQVPDGPLEVVLDTEATNLHPRVAPRDWRLPGVWGMSGFFARRAKGYGTFYDRDDFRRAGFTNLSQLLAADGVTRNCQYKLARCGPTVVSDGGIVLLRVWVDGVIQIDEDADAIPLDDIAGVEYYPPLPRALFAGDLATDRKWIVDTRYFLGEPLWGGMVIVWTRGYDGPPG